MFALLGMVLFAEGQRRYAAVSVLSAGQWTKVSVDHQGIYTVSAAFLKNAGLTTAIPSANIRIFGTGGGVLPESNQQAIADDLPEVAVDMNDGGDGVFDGNDFFLFYAPGQTSGFFSRQQANSGFRKILTATNPSILSILGIPRASASQKCLWYRIPAP